MTWPQQYASLLRQLVAFGKIVDSREGPAKELGPSTQAFYLLGWHQIEGRGGATRFARLEQLCYLAGVPPGILGEHYPHYRELAGYRGGWPGAYGPRLTGQMGLVVEELAIRPTSRRAVAVIWEERDLANAVMDPLRPEPCTLSLQFYVREGLIHGHAVMRSCDAWFGLYYDVPAFAFLTRCVGWCLGLHLGSVHLTVNSLHLYRQHWDRVGGVLPKSVGFVDPLVHLADEAERTPWRGGEPVNPIDPRQASAWWEHLAAWANEQLREELA